MVRPTNGERRRAAYIRSLAPEIQLAESRTYPPHRPFINTKWIFRQIRDNRKDYPVLGARTEVQIKIDITEYLVTVAKYRAFSNGHNGTKGRTFVRDVPAGIAVGSEA